MTGYYDLKNKYHHTDTDVNHFFMTLPIIILHKTQSHDRCHDSGGINANGVSTITEPTK